MIVRETQLQAEHTPWDGALLSKKGFVVQGLEAVVSAEDLSSQGRVDDCRHRVQPGAQLTARC